MGVTRNRSKRNIRIIRNVQLSIFAHSARSGASLDQVVIFDQEVEDIAARGIVRRPHPIRDQRSARKNAAVHRAQLRKVSRRLREGRVADIHCD
jgi:hypothetical protein